MKYPLAPSTSLSATKLVRLGDFAELTSGESGIGGGERGINGDAKGSAGGSETGIGGEKFGG